MEEPRFEEPISAYEALDHKDPPLDEAGNMRAGYFGDDLVHLKPPAYAAFTARVRPILEDAWGRVTTAEA